MDLSSPSGLATLAYPVADIAICAVVLTLGMRQAVADRLGWFCMGAGLLALAVTDSMYVRLLAEGATGATGTPAGARLGRGPGADRAVLADRRAAPPGAGTGTST